VLNEIKSQPALDMVVDWIGENYLALSEISKDDPEVTKLISEIDRINSFPTIDVPEATALLLAKRGNIENVLSENKATIAAVELQDFKNIKIWTALEVIQEAITQGFLPINSTQEIKNYFEGYCEDTTHEFKKDKLERVIKDLEKEILNK